MLRGVGRSSIDERSRRSGALFFIGIVDVQLELDAALPHGEHGCRHYGGGGSGMYWFEEGQNHMWPSTKDSELTGMYLVDTLEPESRWLPLSH